jgi:hypothetical protein
MVGSCGISSERPSPASGKSIGAPGPPGAAAGAFHQPLRSGEFQNRRQRDGPGVRGGEAVADHENLAADSEIGENGRSWSNPCNVGLEALLRDLDGQLPA